MSGIRLASCKSTKQLTPLSRLHLLPVLVGLRSLTSVWPSAALQWRSWCFLLKSRLSLTGSIPSSRAGCVPLLACDSSRCAHDGVFLAWKGDLHRRRRCTLLAIHQGLSCHCPFWCVAIGTISARPEKNRLQASNVLQKVVHCIPVIKYGLYRLSAYLHLR